MFLSFPLRLYFQNRYRSWLDLVLPESSYLTPSHQLINGWNKALGCFGLLKRRNNWNAFVPNPGYVLYCILLLVVSFVYCIVYFILNIVCHIFHIVYCRLHVFFFVNFEYWKFRFDTNQYLNNFVLQTNLKKNENKVWVWFYKCLLDKFFHIV